MFLLDTVVISELRKPLRQRNPNLVNWIEASRHKRAIREFGLIKFHQHYVAARQPTS